MLLWAGPSPPPRPAAPRAEPAAGSSATLCLALLGSRELQLLGPRGCSGLHGSTGLGSSGWFVKDILNARVKPWQGGEGGGEPQMGIGGAQPCPGAPGLQAEASLLEEGRQGPQQGRQTEVRGCRVWSGGLHLGGTSQGQDRPGRSRRLGSLEPAPHPGSQRWAWGVRAVHGDPTARGTPLGSGGSQALREDRSGVHSRGKRVLRLGVQP